jgi:C_GCAxxG_C_C family probable redox protein
MKKTDKAAADFASAFNCSQSVLAAFAHDHGMAEETCMKIACAFGGGMGRQQHVCGAVTGALMALGLHFGQGTAGEVPKKTDTYARAQEFMKEFEKRNGSLHCRELLQGLDMNDPTGLARINELDLFKTNCRKYVRDAVEITEGMIKR